MFSRFVATLKTIQEKSEKASLKKPKLAINDIRQDNSQNKQVSHNVIVGSVSKNNEYFNLYIISELHVLLSAYGIKSRKVQRNLSWSTSS